jgi:hypothetical protein
MEIATDDLQQSIAAVVLRPGSFAFDYSKAACASIPDWRDVFSAHLDLPLSVPSRTEIQDGSFSQYNLDLTYLCHGVNASPAYMAM